MKKRVIQAGVSAAVLAGILLCAGWIDMGLSYTVQADNSDLAERAVRFLDRGAEHPVQKEIRLCDWVDLGDERYVLMEIVQAGEARLGTIALEKGLNGRYKIDHIGWGGGNFREKVVDAGGQKYYLFGGRNAYFGIEEIRSVLDGREYVLDVPAGERFLVCIEIDPAVKDSHGDLEKLRFYNGSGEDITDQIPWD